MRKHLKICGYNENKSKGDNMSYLGYVGLMTEHCSKFKTPRVLEIGVDRGQTALPLLTNLLGLRREFEYVGVDVRADGCFYEQTIQMKGIRHNFNFPPDQCNTFYFIHNSLDALPALIEDGWKFDLILIDGDHNYGTVKQELAFLPDISHSATLVICDDYAGRHANKDTFYSDYSSHQDIEIFREVEQRSDKQGVNQAIDEWVEAHPEWELSKPDDGFEAVMLLPAGRMRIQPSNLEHGLSSASWDITLQPRGSDYLLLI
jgi:hypothetical protein